MATKKGLELSDEDLLGGDDADGTRIDGDDVDFGGGDDNGESGVLGAEPPGKTEIVIIDGDEGGEEDLSAGHQEEHAERVDQDESDPGEAIDPDTLLTQNEAKTWSKDMQKRVFRERRLRKISDATAAAATQRAVEATAQANAAILRALNAEKVSVDLLEQNITGSLAQKQVELEAAIESGASKDQARLQAEISNLQATQREVVASKRVIEERLKEPPKVAKPPNPQAELWKSRNKWFGNQDFAEQAAILSTLDKQLAQDVVDGKFAHNQNTPEYFDELDRRVHRNMPQLRSKIQKVFGGGARPRAAPPAGGGGAGHGKPRQGRIELTRAQLESAKEFGIDIKDPKAVLAYARASQNQGEMSHG